jgi:hypothetical protein
MLAKEKQYFNIPVKKNPILSKVNLRAFQVQQMARSIEKFQISEDEIEPAKQLVVEKPPVKDLSPIKQSVIHSRK